MYYGNCSNNSIYNSRIKNEEEKVVLEVPVPGFEKKDLNLTVKENYLLLNGKNDRFTFEDSYRLGDKLDKENIDAEVVNGVLVVTFKKNVPEKKEIVIN